MSESRENERYFCGHCNRKVSKTLYFTHKKLYYDVQSQEWISGAQDGAHDEVQDFAFSDSDENEVGS